MKRVVIIIGLLLAAGVLFWFVPLFHVVAVEQARTNQQAEFSAAAFAKTFWTERLVPSLDQAADAGAVLTAIRENTQEARERFGRSAGLGRSALYYLKGSGTIVSVDKQGVGVSLTGDAGAPDILLYTGLLFRNTVRDATGLLNASDYPNSQQFNDISVALNRIVEATVIPSVKEQAQVGRRIQFVGCAEVLNLPSDLKPLKVIPLDVRFE